MFKNKRINKYISTLLALVIALSGLGIGMFAYGDDSSLIAINSTNFPDRNWRSIVSQEFDGYDGTARDGYLSQSEISLIYSISVDGLLEDLLNENAEITDLTGIEYFTSCTRLRCANIGLESLDVSKMPQLITLTCMGNPLGSLDLSKNTNLSILNCSDLELTSLDLSHNTALTELICKNNSLTDIDTSALTELKILSCPHNEITSLDLSNNTALTQLNCSGNHLTELDLSNNTLLTNVTDSFIGNQTVSATARIEKNNIFVKLKINDKSRIVSTSVDRIQTIDDTELTVLGYDGLDFTPADIDAIADGIDYYYDTGLDNAESMNVHIDVKRDFYQVKFFTDETKSTLISSQRVNSGESATAVELTDVPQCKAFDSWSEDLTNIQSDLEVYPIWADDHDIQIVSFNDDVVTIKCANCDDKDAEYVFSKLVNAKAGTLRYVEAIDINKDGIINAKDYAKLIKMFK
jgi:hypothetical protein